MVSAFSAISRDQAQLVIQEFEKHALEIAKESGFKLTRPAEVSVRWKKKSISAYFDWGGIVITGGFVEHPIMTPDTMASILCHELGHGKEIGLTGLKPLPSDSPFGDIETRADYFAFHSCMPKLLKRSAILRDMKNERLHHLKIPKSIEQECETQEKSKHCMRLVDAVAANTEIEYQEYFQPMQEYIKNLIQEKDRKKMMYQLKKIDALFEDFQVSFFRSPQGGADYVQCRLQSRKEGVFGSKPNGCNGRRKKLLSEINRRQCHWYKYYGVVTFESFIHCGEQTFFNR